MSLHSFTPQLRGIDPRGLLVREVSWHRIDQAAEAQVRVTRHVWDEAGRSVADWDPRLWEISATANSRKTPSLSGQALLDESVDAGWRLALSGADGQSVERWDGRGSYSRTDYDDSLRPVSVTEKLIDSPPNVVERFAYGDASGLCAEHNQCGRLIRHDDPAGTLCAQEFGLAGGVLIENRRFLQTDELPSWPPDSGQRDALLEPGAGHTTTTVFDATAALIVQTDAVGNRTEHFNTVGGFLREIRLTLADAQTFQTLISDLRYNPTGQLERERLGNGVVSEKTYEAQSGRLIRIFSSRADNTVLQDLNYRYDPVGNVVEIEDAAQATRFFANQRIDPVSRYRYDTLYQLIEASGREVSTGASHGPALPTRQNLPLDPNQLSIYTQNYDYDAGGNLLEMRHVGAQSFTRKMLIAPDSNRSLPEADVDLDFDKGFDANGNLRQLIRGQDLRWDLRNQLRSVSAVERENGSNDEERYVYDSSGQRCRKIRSAVVKSRALVGEVRYLPSLELRTEASGETLQVSTIQTGRNNVRVLHWPGEKPEGIADNQIRYTLSDQLGSSTLELDDKGELISQENYYPFGGTSWWAARSAVEAKYKTIRYSGKERDASGLYYYGFRYYAPWLQRWLNPDPLNDVDGLNVYCFVGNNPSTMIDVGGRMETEPDDFFNSFMARVAAGYVRPPPTAATSQSSRTDPSIVSQYAVPSPQGTLDARVSTLWGDNEPPEDPYKTREKYIAENFLHTYKDYTDFMGVESESEEESAYDDMGFFRETSTSNVSQYASMGGYLAESYDLQTNNQFIVNFTPEKWTILDIFKTAETEEYSTNDVIRYQYQEISELYGFPGTLPASIEHHNVLNSETLAHTEALTSLTPELHSTFLNQTPNGKVTQRIVNDFYMNPISTSKTSTSGELDITTQVTPPAWHISWLSGRRQ